MVLSVTIWHQPPQNREFGVQVDLTVSGARGCEWESFIAALLSICVLNQSARLIFFLCCALLSSSACPVGQFKWGTEGQCTTCPGFSYATTRGASVCLCRSGYLRAKSDTPDTPCTSKCAER